jgi:hypothetical protein
MIRKSLVASPLAAVLTVPAAARSADGSGAQVVVQRGPSLGVRSASPGGG